EGFPATRIGPHFARVAATASAVLHTVAPRAWRVDFDGVTRHGKRAASTYTGAGARTRVAPAADVIEIATESISALVPGVSVDGSDPATDVEYVIDSKRLVARVYAGRPASRRLDAFARILAALDPRHRYRGTFEFRVVTQTGERLNLQPVRSATGLS